jgi:hypothetical protein
LPGWGTNAFQKTSLLMSSGISSATRAITVPPKEWPSRMMSLTSQLTRMLASALVDTYPVVDADGGGRPGSVLPRGLRRAMELVEHEREADLSVAVPAAAASSSPRALQEGFRKPLDMPAQRDERGTDRLSVGIRPPGPIRP